MKIKHARTRLLALTIIFALLTPSPARVTAQRGSNENVADAGQKGLRFRLSEGREQAERTAPAAVGLADMLSAAETKRLLDRLPNLAPDANDTQDFALRESSLPPPRAGKIIQAAFTAPATDAPPAPTTTRAPLEVLRFAPEGEIALAPAFSITFSQPMVAVSSQEDAAASVPVKMTPQPEGAWRWLGAQTLTFQPRVEGGRLPMATAYTVTVPAGTKSALGNALAETKTFKFATPPPTLKNFQPQGTTQPRDALMFLEFDQNINAARVLEHLRLQTAPAGTRLRLATQEEIDADPLVVYYSKQAQAGRWLAFRAVGANGATKDALPADTSIKIVIPPGTPSAEGPRTTVKEQSAAFRTYGALRVINAACTYEQKCSPFDQFSLSFNNQLDEAKFNPAQVTIKPDIPGAKIGMNFNVISIDGAKRSNTTYTVTLDPGITDRFGQRLAGNNVFTFKVTTAAPRLFTTSENFAVLDPAGLRAFTVYSVNYPKLRVTLRRVTPADWTQFRRYQGERANQNAAHTPPGTLVFDEVIEVKAAADELVETAIDLSPALTNGFGQVFVRVEPAANPADKTTARANRNARRSNFAEAWVQATEIGLDAFADRREIIAWANSLRDGKPLAGVEMTVSPDGLVGTTGADGLARLAFKAAPERKGQQGALLVARRGDDTAILPQRYYPYYYANEGNISWRRDDPNETLRWYVLDDRKLYRPGEEVNVKGWIRKVNLTATGDTEMYTPAAGELANYVLKDAQGNEITKGSVKLNALAGFNLKLQLPATMNLGGANLFVELSEQGGGHVHQFQVQEFRRPEFEIKARVSEAPHFVGSSATVTTTAAYFAGGSLPDTEVNWTVSSQPTNYTPPNRDDYTFGTFYPWWRGDRHERGGNLQSFKGRTDAEGKHSVRIDFDGVEPARPSSVTAEARVQDVNRQTFAAKTTLLVHPADVYVGLRPARTFVQKGEAFDISTIVTDLDGRALANRDVNFRLVRLEYVLEKGSWQQREQDAQEQILKSGAQGVRVRFQAKEGGMYRLTARVRDERERLNESELSLWVAGGKTPPRREVAQEQVELIPDRKSYGGGETAEILVQSPFAPAEGVVTLRRSGLLRTERFTMNESSYTLRIPLEEAMTPNVNVQVDLVGAATRVDDAGVEMANVPKRPAYATGEINLDIPPASRRLTVEATPREAVLEPGAETLVEVKVKDAAGRSVEGTDTAVIVVDESVLALTAYSLADPLSLFYAHRDEDVNDYHLREKLRLANPAEVKEKMEEAARGGRVVARQLRELPPGARDQSYVLNATSTEVVEVAAGAVGAGAGGAPMPMPEATPVPAAAEPEGVIQLRQNFNALAVFAASLPTDANGRAQVKVKLPDNLTRYRIMAVSVAGGKQFGAGESNITARQPLMARPSAPRFLNYGDRAELPVVLQNQTDEAMSVAVAVRSTNADLTDGAGRRVQVPANNRVEVRFPIAAVKPGAARFQIVAVAGNKADAAIVNFPVYTPATTEAFATYGVIDQGAISQPVQAPNGVVQSFGGLEVTTASTQLQELTDAVIYLVNYPYECSEQIASRVLALAALKDVLTAFKAKDLPAPGAMRDSVSVDLKRLQGLQNEDGGFDFWRRGKPSVPYVSIHVAHALVRAGSKDYAVPAEMLRKSLGYLRVIESKIPREYSVESKRAIRAYALYVRALTKDRDGARARKLIAEAGGVEKLSIESLGWLLPVLSGDAAYLPEREAIIRHLNNRVTETAGAAHFADAYSDGEYTILHSDRRADGVILEALIGERPESDLIPKLVRGLLSHRKRGHWSNTQENVFILLALDRYFNTYERATPDFVARVWLGGGYAGEQAFKGRSIDRQQLNLPMTTLVERSTAAPVNLTIGKEGAGRLYFRIGTKYAPANLSLAAADYGFRVARKYEAIDEPADVRRDPDGTWRIKAGARVRVRLTMSNPARRYHVALVDPLPAGLEALNAALATTEQLPEGSTESGVYSGGRGITDFYWYHRGPWYEHQNLRDERVEAFASLLWEGEHEYSYFARATTPGLFVVPPAKAEEMYSPETFGRGASDRVRVE